MDSLMVVLPNGNVAVGGNHYPLAIVNPSLGKLVVLGNNSNTDTICIERLPSGNLVTSSSNGLLHIWNLESGECQNPLETMEVCVQGMDFSSANLSEPIAKLLWHNGANISERDYNRWVKPHLKLNYDNRRDIEKER